MDMEGEDPRPLSGGGKREERGPSKEEDTRSDLIQRIWGAFLTLDDISRDVLMDVQRTDVSNREVRWFFIPGGC